MFRLLLSSFFLIWVLSSCQPSPSNLAITVLSSEPDRITSGTARIAITAKGEMDLNQAIITLNDTDITNQFELDDTESSREGVLQNLPEGVSTLTVSLNGDIKQETLTNHPATGPIFSGPHQEPFLCASREHLEAAMLEDQEFSDTFCSLERQVSFMYRSSNTGGFLPFDPDAPRPDDIAQTELMDGRRVDFIVRWERGTLNRFIYSLAMLAPEQQALETPDHSAWNKKLIYYFQGGVGIGHYQGAPSRQRMLYEHGLSQGYAIAYSTGTKTGVHYDLQVGGETALMVKERFIVAHGTPEYTVGVGGSGGGIQQYVYGQNHPGLIDAAIPQYSYPDMVTQGIHIGDCELLERYMDAEVRANPDSKWATWSNRTWLQGLNASDTVPNRYTGEPGNSECINGWRGLSPLTLNPHYGTAPGIDPETQQATSWTHFDDLVQIYGMAQDGFARRTWDNVGVQYGLEALKKGQIEPEEFLDLNARIGGWKNEPDMVQEGQPFLPDGDGIDVHSARNMTLSENDQGDPPAPRTQADPGAIEAIQASGMVFKGSLDIPIIDWRHYLEEVLDMHNSHQSFAARQRMLNADQDADNQVIWFTDTNAGNPNFDQTPMAFEVIDEWMKNIKNNPEKTVSENKPAQAEDSCFSADGSLIYSGNDAWEGILNEGPKGPCAEQFPVYSTSRIVAGAPITGDIFKCERIPVTDAIEQNVYGDWQPDEKATSRLQQIFPSGVCTYP